MAWFTREKKGISTETKKDMPEGLWIKCDGCSDIIYKPELDKNLGVCTKCQYHFKISSSEYIDLLLDNDSFQETDPEMVSDDPLKFKDTKKYTDRVKAATNKSGLKDAVRTGYGRINDLPVVVGVMDFAFIGGSMGSVVGEKIKRAIDRAIETGFPLIVISATGGARMMEGILSLMQMAKTSAKLAKLNENKGLYISVLTNPTTAGVMASYAMLGDIIIAEPGALIGFAGPRVIKQTIGEDLPKGFQTSEFVQEKGFVDMIINRHQLRDKILETIEFFQDDKKEIKTENSSD
ncbi:MAG: acetyl-CoA carboxylase carboxyltransferase subunit beta [bacterium]|nr:acetyl-CoA carboxylase carboxyltransferase subunit beta [bacterium]